VLGQLRTSPKPQPDCQSGQYRRAAPKAAR
jgi:hypothetical protein